MLKLLKVSFTDPQFSWVDRQRYINLVEPAAAFARCGRPQKENRGSFVKPSNADLLILKRPAEFVVGRFCAGHPAPREILAVGG